MRLSRWMHRLYAFAFGYFWMSCPKCGRMFGGHEEGGGIMHLGGGRGKIMCPLHPDDEGEEYLAQIPRITEWRFVGSGSV